MDDKKLQTKVMAEDLSYTNTVKYGLSLEQGRKKVDKINTTKLKKEEDGRVTRLEEQVRMLQTKPKTSTSAANCQTCTRPTH